MIPKNRKFNIAGTSFHSGKARIGSVVHFALEPKNPKDPNAVQVINGKKQLIGYMPKELAEEINRFVNGKYKHYCAKVVDLWKIPDGEREGELVPKVLSHFANLPEELPYLCQPWLDPLCSTIKDQPCE